MGTTLTGLTPATTYDALIKVGDNGPIDGTLKVLSDGLGTNLPMEASATGINFTGNLTQSGTALQPVLVSGTNIKTINSTSILGSGNIAVVTSPSGVSGAIQFSNGSAFASDATNLFWDDTNNRLGVGTNAPIYGTQLQSDTSGPNTLIWSRAAGSLNTSGIIFSVADNTVSGNQYHKGGIFFKGDGAGAGRGSLILVSNTANDASVASSSNVGIALLSSGNNSIGTLSDLSARLGIRGSGSTSATTSLLVQNSAGTELLKVNDGLNAYICNQATGNVFLGQTAGYGGLTVNGGSGFVSATAFAYLHSDVFTASGYQTVLRVTGNGGIGQVSVGTTSPNASAKFQIDATNAGFLPPRMTTTQKNAIATPAAGLVVYDSTTNKLQCYNGSTWNDLF
jgi:hypothetical protein